MPAPKGSRPPNAGKGRPKGAANKVTRTLREMILGALDDAGGQAYLAEQARENPMAFIALLGRLLPREPLHSPPAVITLDFGFRRKAAPAPEVLVAEDDAARAAIVDVKPALPLSSPSNTNAYIETE